MTVSRRKYDNLNDHIGLDSEPRRRSDMKDDLHTGSFQLLVIDVNAEVLVHPNSVDVAAKCRL